MKTIPYPSVDTAALRSLMAAVGPVPEWAWIDYLSPGDTLRVAWLRGIARDPQTPVDVAQAAALALAEIRRAAEQRMVTVPTPESREVAPGESVKQRWTLDEIKAAFLRAEETGRPEGARRRSEDDLENSWSHLRGALTGEQV
jgi:hypothetical protein